MAKNRNNLTQISDIVQKMSTPMSKFSNLNSISSIVNGLMGTLPVILTGAIFMIIYVLGSPSIGTSGKALLPFLSPLASKFLWMNTLTLNKLVKIATNSPLELKAVIKIPPDLSSPPNTKTRKVSKLIIPEFNPFWFNFFP